jgi:TonB family protein
VADSQAASNSVKENVSAIFDFNRCQKPTWPKEALLAGKTGTTTLSFTVDLTGKVTSVQFIQSSGIPILDEAAAEGLKNCYGQVRGKIENCRAVEYTLQMQYVWTLE